jgi:hypothetical protein
MAYNRLRRAKLKEQLADHEERLSTLEEAAGLKVSGDPPSHKEDLRVRRNESRLRALEAATEGGNAVPPLPNPRQTTLPGLSNPLDEDEDDEDDEDDDDDEDEDDEDDDE